MRLGAATVACSRSFMSPPAIQNRSCRLQLWQRSQRSLAWTTWGGSSQCEAWVGFALVGNPWWCRQWVAGKQPRWKRSRRSAAAMLSLWNRPLKKSCNSWQVRIFRSQARTPHLQAQVWLTLQMRRTPTGQTPWGFGRMSRILWGRTLKLGGMRGSHTLHRRCLECPSPLRRTLLRILGHACLLGLPCCMVCWVPRTLQRAWSTSPCQTRYLLPVCGTCWRCCKRSRAWPVLAAP
mmetsp:Transcript_11868/g.22990  ORF Transcript_11868/g.22990 Transcript_11868/m.22990 type:complete len:235 (+) Transcript_11868:614-1318(+)